MSENSAASSESNRLGGGGLIKAGVLRPSVLGSSINSANHTASSLFEAKIRESNYNPFKNAANDEDEAEADAPVVAETNVSTINVKESTADDKKKEDDDDDEEVDERPDPLKMLRKNGMERANIFAAAKTSIPRVGDSGFVFGQNVHERVVGENVKPDNSGKSEATSSSSELLFSSVIQNAAAKFSEAEENSSTTEATSTASASIQENEGKSLTDVAREYEESRARKRTFEEVETFTGEENEVNIVDISCKLFAFVNSNWEERGRGSLRLNDSKNELECSRVVFRTSGNLRLLLNTKVWAGMVAERPSQKSLRLTAMDNTGKIKVFLAQARPVEISQLHKALTQRIDLRKISHPEEGCTVDGSNGSNNEQTEAKNGASSSFVDAHVSKSVQEKKIDGAASDDDTDNEEELAASSPKKAAVPAPEPSN